MTQCERIVRHLDDYGSITGAEAVYEYGIMRLPARISDLEKLGFTFRRVTECSKNRYGEKTHYTRYFVEANNGKHS